MPREIIAMGVRDCDQSEMRIRNLPAGGSQFAMITIEEPGCPPHSVYLTVEQVVLLGTWCEKVVGR